MKTSTHLSAVLVVAFVAGIYCDRDSVRSAPEDEHAGGLPFRRDRTGRQPRQLSWSSWSRRDSAPPHIGQVSTTEEDKFRKGIKFQLYTRENPEEPDLIDVYNYDEPNLRHFDAGRPTKVITHGWWTDGVGLVRLRKAFLDAMDVNLIAVDWTGVDTLFYPTARSHVTQIGQRLAYLLDLLRMARGVPLSSVHLIGHSMGAHVVGVAGKMVQWGAVGRITGLDPAGPLFATDPTRRLNASDALFVDVIHTCANVLGYSDSLGHADFYPNGGVCVQPGCTLLDLTRGTCSHNRGFDYLEESIRLGSSFKAYPCKGASRAPDLSDPTKAVAMGLVVSTEANGAYCLATRDKSPFALNYEEQKKALLEIRKHGNKLNPSLHHFLIDSDDNSLTTVESPEEDNEVGAATGDRLRDRAILRAFLKRRGTDYISRRLRRPKTPENKSF